MLTDTDKIVAAILANAVMQKSQNSKSPESAVEYYNECLSLLNGKPTAAAFDPVEDAIVRRLNNEAGG